MRDRSVVGRRLRQARGRAGLSQRRLGIEAGMDEFSASARMNQYERGVHVPDFGTLERLARVLGVPVPYFYARDDVLAELILRVGVMPGARRRRLLTQLRAEGRSTVNLRRARR